MDNARRGQIIKEAKCLDPASRVCTEHKVNNSVVLLDVVCVCLFVCLFACLLCYDSVANEVCVCVTVFNIQTYFF
jgi:hypothetical protein